MTSMEWFDIERELTKRGTHLRYGSVERECIWQIRLALADHYHACAAARRSARYPALPGAPKGR